MNDRKKKDVGYKVTSETGPVVDTAKIPDDWLKQTGPSFGQRRKMLQKAASVDEKTRKRNVKQALRTEQSGPTVVVKGVKRKKPQPRRLRRKKK